MSSSNSPCAACKILRRKCTQDCVFAPYFRPDNPQRFAYVHKVFGASNVAKILSDLSPAQREDAVISLAYEAEARLRDPVYGCVGIISVLQHRLKQLQAQLLDAEKELAAFVGPHPSLPLLQPPRAVSASSVFPPNLMPPAIMGIPTNVGPLSISDPQENRILETRAQQLAPTVGAREQQGHMTLNDASVFGSVFNESSSSATPSPSMVFGPIADPFYQLEYGYSLDHQIQEQLMLTTQQPQQPQSLLSPSQPKSEGEEARSISSSC